MAKAATARKTAEPKVVTVEMTEIDEKKGSVKFFTNDAKAAFSNIYINKSIIPDGYTGVAVTVEFLTD